MRLLLFVVGVEVTHDIFSKLFFILNIGMQLRESAGELFLLKFGRIDHII